MHRLTPADLRRLAGYVRLLPPAERLALRTDDGFAPRLDYRVEEIINAVPDLLDLVQDQAVALMSAPADALDDIRIALRLPADATWSAVVARARSLADADPMRTLDGEVDCG